MEHNKKQATKAGLMLRALVAVYVLYLAYDLLRGIYAGQQDHRGLILAAVIVFLGGGGAILVSSLVSLAKGNYADPMADQEESGENMIEEGGNDGQTDEIERKESGAEKGR